MITFPFTDVINAIRNAKKGVEVRENLAQMGEYCKQFTEEAGQKANAARDEAKGYAADAKASEKKATDAVAGIDQTKTDAVQAVQQAQTTATNAVQQAQSTATTAVTTKQTEAVQAVGTAQTGAVKAVDDERDAALQQVANSTQAAETAASDAAAFKQAAQASKEAAAASAGAAESSATAASGSASAAATSESNAATSAQNAETDADRAEAAAALAGTRASTDKELKTENAPADAKATGEALKDRLSLSGGKMGGNIDFANPDTGNVTAWIGATSNDSSNGPGQDLNNLVINSWQGVSFSSSNQDGPYANKTAVGIDCRNGIVKAARFEGEADNSAKWGNYERRFNEETDSTLVLVETDGKYVDLRPADSIGLTAFAASDPHYVRFNDGTQICWELGAYVDGYATETNRRVNFPVPFTDAPAILTTANVNAGSDTIISIGWESATAFSIGANGSDRRGITSWIAIGRWK